MAPYKYDNQERNMSCDECGYKPGMKNGQIIYETWN